VHPLCTPHEWSAQRGEQAMGYEQLLAEVRRLVRASIDARYRGELHLHKVRAQAYADGYMRALADAGLIAQDELLQAVAEARNEVAGAAFEQRVAADDDQPRAAAG
jgi:hypothetical protein